jgi:protease PrsW
MLAGGPVEPLPLILGLFLSFGAAAVPTAIYAALVWWCDRFEREPWPLVLASFLWGAFPAVVLSLALESLVAQPLGGVRRELAGQLLASSMFVPVIEETAKAGALVLILLFFRHEIDNLVDGILYGAMVGFGFAMTENLLYYVGALLEGGWSEWGALIFLRGVVFGLNHAFFTALTGAAIGYARMAKGRLRRYGVPLMGLGAAVVAHAVHNLGVELASENVLGILLSMGSDAAGVLLVGAMIVIGVQQERRWLRHELAAEVGRLFTREEYEALQSIGGRWHMLSVARAQGGWHAARLAGEYQHSATELAFYKRRAEAHGLDRALEQRIGATTSRLVRLRSQLGWPHAADEGAAIRTSGGGA